MRSGRPPYDNRFHWVAFHDDMPAPPPIPNGQIAYGSNPRLPPNVQAMPDLRAKSKVTLTNNPNRLAKREKLIETDQQSGDEIDQLALEHWQRGVEWLQYQRDLRSLVTDRVVNQDWYDLSDYEPPSPVPERKRRK